MRLIRSRRQTNQEIFIGMNRDGLERHLLRHEQYTANVCNVHHDLEAEYIRGFILSTSEQNQRKLALNSKQEKLRQIHLSNLWYGYALGTFPGVNINIFPDDYIFTRVAKLSYTPMELVGMVAGLLYSLGTRFNTNDFPFCFKPIVPEGGLPQISKSNLDSAMRYFINARLEMMDQLELPQTGSLTRKECIKLVDRLQEGVVITEPIYA